ncbi:hypothetical protein Hanom_Chr11g01031391 [Helianthus anomalus]
MCNVSVGLCYNMCDSFFLNITYKKTTSYFCENTIVLAQGEMWLDGIFQVQTFGFPPLEDIEKNPGLIAQWLRK